MLKPHLACDWQESKVVFPILVQPKIDGVRGTNLEGTFTGRSLKTHGNRYTTQRFSQLYFLGLDGELAAAEPNHPDLCRLTTSAVNTHEGTPNLSYWVFDLLTDEVRDRPYHERYAALEELVHHLYQVGVDGVYLVPSTLVNNMEELLELEAKYVGEGYEGVILRDPEGRYKNGRATAKEGAFLRIKRFVEEEAVVLEIVEGSINNNEAKTNELGRTERSSHKENLVPNGMVGTLVCEDVKTGKVINVAPGAMTHYDREFYFRNPSALVGQIIKYRTFPKGVKDKPRFPTFHSLRAASDVPAAE